MLSYVFMFMIGWAVLVGLIAWKLTKRLLVQFIVERIQTSVYYRVREFVPSAKPRGLVDAVDGQYQLDCGIRITYINIRSNHDTDRNGDLWAPEQRFSRGMLYYYSVGCPTYCVAPSSDDPKQPNTEHLHVFY